MNVAEAPVDQRHPIRGRAVAVAAAGLARRCLTLQMPVEATPSSWLIHPAARPSCEGAGRSTRGAAADASSRSPSRRRATKMCAGRAGATGAAVGQDHPGGLAAVWPEAGAGGADLRRQRSRRRLAATTIAARAPPDVGRGRPRNIAAAGFTTPRRSPRRARDSDASAWRGLVSQYQAARLRARAPSDQFDVRFDVPAKCARCSTRPRSISGLIPAIEYLRGDYASCRASRSRRMARSRRSRCSRRVPIETSETIALDVSSRTSVALTRVLCASTGRSRQRYAGGAGPRRDARAPTRRWSSAIPRSRSIPRSAG